MFDPTNTQSAAYNPLLEVRRGEWEVRDVQNFLKAGKVAEAKKAWTAFDDNWDNIEDLVKERSRDAYDNIEKNMVALEKQLMPLPFGKTDHFVLKRRAVAGADALDLAAIQWGTGNRLLQNTPGFACCISNEAIYLRPVDSFRHERERRRIWIAGLPSASRDP